MRKTVLKWKTRNRVIISLAYAHRYLYPILVVLIPLLIGRANLFLLMGICVSAFSAYSFLGYKLRWKHIYCSYQIAYRKEVTPDHIRWGMIKKSDAYGVPIIFGVMGVACVVCHFLFV
jgi:hypothetical protein